MKMEGASVEALDVWPPYSRSLLHAFGGGTGRTGTNILIMIRDNTRLANGQMGSQLSKKRVNPLPSTEAIAPGFSWTRASPAALSLQSWYLPLSFALCRLLQKGVWHPCANLSKAALRMMSQACDGNKEAVRKGAVRQRLVLKESHEHFVLQCRMAPWGSPSRETQKATQGDAWVFVSAGSKRNLFPQSTF